MHYHLYAALKLANDKFGEKLSSGKKSSDKEMFSLCWSVDELGRLNKSGRKLYVDIGALLALLNNPETDLVHENVARSLAKAQESLLPFICGVTRHQRHAATQVLVTMISPSQNHMLLLLAAYHMAVSPRVRLILTSTM